MGRYGTHRLLALWRGVRESVAGGLIWAFGITGYAFHRQTSGVPQTQWNFTAVWLSATARSPRSGACNKIGWVWPIRQGKRGYSDEEYHSTVGMVGARMPWFGAWGRGSSVAGSPPEPVLGCACDARTVQTVLGRFWNACSRRGQLLRCPATRRASAGNARARCALGTCSSVALSFFWRVEAPA